MEAVYKSFTKLLDCGKLLVPSSTAIAITLNICQIWKRLVNSESSRRKLLECYLPRKVFIKVVKAVEDDVQLSGLACREGHAVVDKVMSKMAGTPFNLFAGNLVRDMNSDVHAKRKPGTASRGGRSQSTDKIRKLSGVKKS